MTEVRIASRQLSWHTSRVYCFTMRSTATRIFSSTGSCFGHYRGFDTFLCQVEKNLRFDLLHSEAGKGVSASWRRFVICVLFCKNNKIQLINA